MNLRQVMAAWALAFAIVTGTTAALVAGVGQFERPDFDRGAIAVIGSSPLLFAVPAEGRGADSLLGDGRPHRRLAKVLLTEAETIALVERALDAHASTILVEANPLLFDFAFDAHRRPCDGWKMALRGTALELRDRLHGGLRGQGWPIALANEPDPALMTRSGAIDMAVVRGNYPLSLRQPCAMARLQALTDRARAQSTELVLVLPPRSPFASTVIGKAADEAIRSHAQALADRLGVELFEPDGAWNNDAFVDFAHVNTVGRRRFLTALRSWWASRR